ncbi:hypothetical protein B0H67DRAFT_497836 [Lasiosphaeris hirsuta]|uniref:Methyltransferase domain-containing protein n=1 Tax=Lasiosphaeris hirsuta TaxID=260670 RepID=A0AA39ZY25_9PEZI|nr:hypothetical protein B0H67DRAFT_497836 [Lasiosphaeris hirsuta]
MSDSTNPPTPTPERSSAAAVAAKANATAYLATIPPEIESGRHLLQRYSHIAAEDVDAHIFRIRDKAWAVFPYGCIGNFWFLNLQPLLQDDLFQRVLYRLRSPGSTESFLDVGCCLGLVVRHLAAEGVSSERLYGTDLQPLFLDLGYELFCDRDMAKSQATFVAGDMVRDNHDAAFQPLVGKIDVIYATAFFFLFERHDQLRAAKRMVSFLRSDNPDAMIFGYNNGKKIPGWEKYVLDVESWRSMWDEVGEATGTSWRTEMEMEVDGEWIKVKFAVYRAL